MFFSLVDPSYTHSELFLPYFPRNPELKMSNLKTVVAKFYDEYVNNTPKKLKLIDAYLFYIVLTGVTQFVYCCLVGTFPFNSFLSGFISTISCFVLGGEYFIIRSLFGLFNSYILFLSCICCSLSTLASEPRE